LDNDIPVVRRAFFICLLLEEYGGFYMFEIGDFLMYGKTGVCQLKGISKEAVLDKKEVAYYVLQPVFKNCSAVLKVPVGNEKVNIRPVASKDQMLAYMEEIASSEPVWNDNDRSRFAEYNESLSSGSVLIKRSLPETLGFPKKPNDFSTRSCLLLSISR
jgi:RNA polymerase-interacting CarD/CdnL/TRCF family regulator